MSYEVIFHPGALRELGKLPKDVQIKLREAIDSLAVEPRPHGVVKLTDADAYRIRVSTHRIVYTVRDDRLVVLIVKVGHRRDVYEEIKTIKRRLGG